MDLSKVKWVLIAVLVFGGFWLVTEGGINYMHKKFTADEPGTDAAIDERNEAGLTRLGAFLMMTFRYQKADEVFQNALDLFPDGVNADYNYFRQARCAEKAYDFKRAVQIMEDLMDWSASDNDPRIPTNDELRLRADKLIEMHDLGEISPRKRDDKNRRLL